MYMWFAQDTGGIIYTILEDFFFLMIWSILLFFLFDLIPNIQHLNVPFSDHQSHHAKKAQGY